VCGTSLPVVLLAAAASPSSGTTGP
jgi:hypothetical protein